MSKFTRSYHKDFELIYQLQTKKTYREKLISFSEKVISNNFANIYFFEFTPTEISAETKFRAYG